MSVTTHWWISRPQVLSHGPEGTPGPAASWRSCSAATTHWRFTDDLARLYPTIEVRPDVLYVDNGQVMTSAGSAAGIDLCLHVVRLDYGAEIANAVARRMVVAAHRDGGQAQFVECPV